MAGPEFAEAATAGSSVEATPFGRDLDLDSWFARLAHVRVSDVEPGKLGRLGEYELLGIAGRGGQGLVYKARQPRTGREVALKRLGAGVFSTPEMRARFEREIEIAAALDHPHIVTIFGSERLDDQLVLAMQWVEGTPFDQWARRRHAREVLEVFIRICEAVQHAHQRGVIHRDLKPSNILVDSQGRPHVLDFGLAKLLTPDGSSAGTLTHTGFVGTPAFASPEQLRGNAAAIDVRTDVYSLGALLYHVLTGEFVIDPALPLAAVVELADQASLPAPSSMNRDLAGDVDAIVLKAVASEPKLRYDSVAELGADVRRYLADEPVLAHPPSATYHLRKFVRMHRAAVAGTTAFILLLVTSTAVSTVLYFRSERARSDAVEARTIAQRALQGRYYWNQRTPEGLQKSVEYFEQAIAKDPSYALAYAGLAECHVARAGHTLMAPRTALEEADRAALRALELDPTIGEAHAVLAIDRALLDWDWAGCEREFRMAIRLNPAHATTHQWFAEFLTGMGRTEDSLAEIEQALALDPLSLPIKATYGRLLYQARRFDESIAVCHKVLEVEPRFMFPRCDLALSLAKLGRIDEAIAEVTSFVEASRRPPMGVAVLGYVLAVGGRTSEAREILDELRERTSREYVSPYMLAVVDAALGEIDRAFALLEDAHKTRAVHMRFLKSDPSLDTLRDDPRFDGLLMRMGLSR